MGMLSLGVAAPETGGVWYENGKPAPDTPSRKSSGEFGAHLIVTDDADALYEFWRTKPGAVPVKAVGTVKAGTRMETVVFFVGCAADSVGHCLVEASATVTTGTGKVLIEDQRLTLSARQRPSGRNLGISENGVGVEADRAHRSYIFTLDVVDRVASRSVTLTQAVVVQE